MAGILLTFTKLSTSLLILKFLPFFEVFPKLYDTLICTYFQTYIL